MGPSERPSGPREVLFRVWARQFQIQTAYNCGASFKLHLPAFGAVALQQLPPQVAWQKWPRSQPRQDRRRRDDSPNCVVQAQTRHAIFAPGSGASQVDDHDSVSMAAQSERREHEHRHRNRSGYRRASGAGISCRRAAQKTGRQVQAVALRVLRRPHRTARSQRRDAAAVVGRWVSASGVCGDAMRPS